MIAPVYFFLHVPKTAGQTIAWHLRQHLPGAFVDVDTAAGRRALEADTSHIRAICGHRLSRRMQEAFAGREIRKVVLLRAPVDLQISLYNFRMLSYRAKGLGTYSLELHLKALPRNFVAQFLLEHWLQMSALQRGALTDAEVFARLNAELAQFWFVGAHTDCDALLAKIAAELGVPVVAVRRNSEDEWHEQVAWEPLRAEHLTADQRARIAADHPVDQALWDSWRSAGFAPNNVRPAAALGRARAGLFRGLLHDALRILMREAAAPGQAARVARADRARESRDWPRAATLYRLALRRASGSPALWLQYARALRDSGRIDKAATAYRSALDLKPDFPTAQAELASLAAPRAIA